MQSLVDGPDTMNDNNGGEHWVRKHFLRYQMREAEMFARAYAQWIATRSGSREMLRQVRSKAQGPYAEHWTATDFAPIGKAMDRLFATAGLLK